MSLSNLLHFLVSTKLSNSLQSSYSPSSLTWWAHASDFALKAWLSDTEQWLKSVKCLLWTFVDLSLNLQHPWRSWAWPCMSITLVHRMGSRVRQISEAHCIAILNKLASSEFSERACLQRQGESNSWRHLLSSSGQHIHMHSTHAHIVAWT